MTRKAKSTEKPGAKRTSKPGIKVGGKTVESSVRANTHPRQPRVRQTPARREQPKPIPKERLKPGPKPTTGASALRKAREDALVEAIEQARATGMLPHEWMLAVMRGEQISHFAYDSETQEIIEVIVLPTFADRMEMAKAAAPFYATKMQKPGGAGGPADPSKQPGVMEVPVADSMQAWADLASASQAKLKKEVTK